MYCQHPNQPINKKVQDLPESLYIAVGIYNFDRGKGCREWMCAIQTRAMTCVNLFQHVDLSKHHIHIVYIAPCHNLNYDHGLPICIYFFVAGAGVVVRTDQFL